MPPGPFAKQRTQSECPLRDPRMPRLSKVGMSHIFRALSEQAVTRTGFSEPAQKAQGGRSRRLGALKLILAHRRL